MSPPPAPAIGTGHRRALRIGFPPLADAAPLLAGEVLGVDLPRPRDRPVLASDPRFLAAREAVLRFLHERHAVPHAAA